MVHRDEERTAKSGSVDGVGDGYGRKDESSVFNATLQSFHDHADSNDSKLRKTGNLIVDTAADIVTLSSVAAIEVGKDKSAQAAGRRTGKIAPNLSSMWMETYDGKSYGIGHHVS